MSKDDKFEIYVSTDIESDGPLPGPNSMLSYASVAFDPEGVVLGTFTENLILLPDAVPDADTMCWWGEPAQQASWLESRKDPQDPVASLTRYVKWVENLPGVEKGDRGVKNAVFVAYPAGFDFLFMYWYMVRYAGHSPFSFSAIDVKSFAMSVLGTNYRNTGKKNMPKRWFSKRPHTHVALDDAYEQGELFINMLKESRAHAAERRSKFSRHSPGAGKRDTDV